MSKLLVALSLTFLLTAAPAEDWKFSGSVEQTLWAADEVPPAFLEFDDGYFYNPRVSLSFDYQPGSRFYFHATGRADRGFDHGTKPDGDFRLDNLILRYRPLGDGRLNFQVGKFPTVVGNWVPTHGYYDDPFLLAPLPYAAINGINNKSPSQHSRQAIANRAKASGATIHRAKTNWSSPIWGPAYSNGISIFGSTEKFDYAFEVKNTGLGSSPEEWELGEGDFSSPLLSARIGYRPDASWAFGLSASHGPYLNAGAPGADNRGDFDQTLIGVDLRWAHRDWIISSEAFFTNYDTLHEDLQSFSYYVQARYKAAPGLWVASRFGQTSSNEIVTPFSNSTPWSPDPIRAELALGWRITPDLLLKTQYARTVITNDLSTPSKNLFGLSLGWRF